MMSLNKAKELGIKPLARVVATGSAAVDAKIMGMGVVPSVQKALHFANLKIEDIDYWEINEAFAAQIIGCNRELKIPLDKMNINGGGISLGHPVGMTGARLIVSLSPRDGPSWRALWRSLSLRRRRSVYFDDYGAIIRIKEGLKCAHTSL